MRHGAGCGGRRRSAPTPGRLPGRGDRAVAGAQRAGRVRGPRHPPPLAWAGGPGRGVATASAAAATSSPCPLRTRLTTAFAELTTALRSQAGHLRATPAPRRLNGGRRGMSMRGACWTVRSGRSSAGWAAPGRAWLPSVCAAVQDACRSPVAWVPLHGDRRAPKRDRLEGLNDFRSVSGGHQRRLVLAAVLSLTMGAAVAAVAAPAQAAPGALGKITDSRIVSFKTRSGRPAPRPAEQAPPPAVPVR